MVTFFVVRTHESHYMVVFHLTEGFQLAQLRITKGLLRKHADFKNTTASRSSFGV